MVALMILEVFPTVISVTIGAMLMIVTGCVRNMDDAYIKTDWERIVLIAAISLDANPYTFLIAVAVASGMAFATPVASPTNALVMMIAIPLFSFMRKFVP